MTLADVVAQLEGEQLRSILDAVVRGRCGTAEMAAPAAALCAELASAFEIESYPSALVTEEELARQALLVLAEDPETAAAIEALAAKPSERRERFDLGLTLAAATAAVAALQTRVQVERGKDGRWSVRVDKKAASDALVKGLVQKLLAWISQGS
jgi:hypothetical protein